MKRIWAEWRMPYIKASQSRACLFCRLKRKRDREAFIVERSKYSFVMLNSFPYNSGHIMVAPLRHVKDLHRLSDEELLDLSKLVARGEKALRIGYKPQGLNIGMNMGRCAGAGVLSHLHIHLVPRWSGDTNFMPVLSETKVLPESLPSTMKRLKRALQKMDNSGAKRKSGRR